MEGRKEQLPNTTTKKKMVLLTEQNHPLATIKTKPTMTPKVTTTNATMKRKMSVIMKLAQLQKKY